MHPWMKHETLRTVSDWIEHLKTFPGDWPVKVSTRAGGEIAVEHRDIKGKPTICIFGENGGRFGENPLTEEEYQKQSKAFIAGLQNGQVYTRCHGDHRLFTPRGWDDMASCYGTAYDPRIIDRMVTEGILEYWNDPGTIGGMNQVRRVNGRNPILDY